MRTWGPRALLRIRRVGWKGEGGGEVDEVVGEVDVDAAGALVVDFGHFAREGGVHVGGVDFVVLVSMSISVGARGLEGCIWWVFGAWMGERHGWCL